MKIREIGHLSTALLGLVAAALGAACGNSVSPSGAGGQASSTDAAGTGGASCAPVSYDTTCGVCAKASCCADYQKCANDANCVCWVGCLATVSSTYQECSTQCGAPGAVMASFSQCTNGSCKPQCGDWTSTTSASASASASSTSSTGSGGNPCSPIAADTTCTTCAKQKCCGEVAACAGDANCTCWIGCSQKNPTNLGVCTMQCGNPDAKTGALGTCTQKDCKDKCP